MASEAEYSDLTDIDELSDEYEAAPAKQKAKGKAKGKGKSGDGYVIRHALKASRATTYSTESLYSPSLFRSTTQSSTNQFPSAQNRSTMATLISSRNTSVVRLIPPNAAKEMASEARPAFFLVQMSSGPSRSRSASSTRSTAIITSRRSYSVCLLAPYIRVSWLTYAGGSGKRARRRDGDADVHRWKAAPYVDP